MLAPLGGAFGFKGAGLAGLVEVFRAVLTGMKLSSEIAPMAGPDLATPRGMGAFVMAIRPEAFVDRDVFEHAIRRYLAALRGSPTRKNQAVLAPGDRDWAEAHRRESAGVPVDPQMVAVFEELAERYALMPTISGA